MPPSQYVSIKTVATSQPCALPCPAAWARLCPARAPRRIGSRDQRSGRAGSAGAAPLPSPEPGRAVLRRTLCRPTCQEETYPVRFCCIYSFATICLFTLLFHDCKRLYYQFLYYQFHIIVLCRFSFCLLVCDRYLYLSIFRNRFTSFSFALCIFGSL